MDVSTRKAVVSSGDRSLPQITNQCAWKITLFTDAQTVVVELPRSYKVFFLFFVFKGRVLGKRIGFYRCCVGYLSGFTETGPPSVCSPGWPQTCGDSPT